MEIGLLSVITPVYKKEKTVCKELTDLHKTLSATGYKFEVIVVVDGTNLDNSLEEAKKCKLSNVRVYGYPTNHGKGQAVRFGMQKAKGDIVTFIDSGGDINPQGITILLEHMKWYGADIIVASKAHPASIVNYPISRRILSKGYYYFVKALFGLKLRDTQTGLKIYKRSVLDKVLDRLVVKRFAFDIEILAVAHSLGYKRIYDGPVEVKWDFKDTTIWGVFTDNGIWNFVYDTISVWYRLKVLRYYKDKRKRTKVYDDELRMYVNTGDMTDKRQLLIRTVNKFIFKPFSSTSSNKK